MATRQEAIDTLHSRNCSCIILKDDEMSVYNGPGISDLLGLLKTQPDKLRGAFVADKVIGKAAAALLILGQTDAVYTDLISEGAIDLLHCSPIQVTFAERVHMIMNRTKDNICPMENLCSDAKDAEECYNRISDFISNKRKESL